MYYCAHDRSRWESPNQEQWMSRTPDFFAICQTNSCSESQVLARMSQNVAASAVLLIKTVSHSIYVQNALRSSRLLNHPCKPLSVHEEKTNYLSHRSVRSDAAYDLKSYYQLSFRSSRVRIRLKHRFSFLFNQLITISVDWNCSGDLRFLHRHRFRAAFGESR